MKLCAIASFFPQTQYPPYYMCVLSALKPSQGKSEMRDRLHTENLITDSSNEILSSNH
ncbi:MAG TPA: hypothetical protein VK211_16785 [Kamptonema sp.]|nr:hypothetical protein [Kamptonema sp.]